MFGHQEPSKNISNSFVEFRAGRMNMIGRMVHPETRKGLVHLSQGHDGLTHFCWKDRTTGKVEDDLIVFPDECEFKRVEQCKTGRVFVLKFKTSSRRMFFWLQEPKTDKDDEYCRRVNELLNKLPSASRSGRNIDRSDIQYVLNMPYQQLMQLFESISQLGEPTSLLGSLKRSLRNTRFGNFGNRKTRRALTSENSNIAKKYTPCALKSKENSLNTTDTGTEKNVNDARSVDVNLSKAIASSDALNAIIAEPKKTSTLSVQPTESCDSEQIKGHQKAEGSVSSPKFKQALPLFSNAFQPAQLATVVSRLELAPNAVVVANAATSPVVDIVKEAPSNEKPKGSNMKDASTSTDNLDNGTKPSE